MVNGHTTTSTPNTPNTRHRSQHKAFAFNYIAKFAKAEAQQKGTGGSDFMPALQVGHGAWLMGYGACVAGPGFGDFNSCRWGACILA